MSYALTTVEVGGATYLYVAGLVDNGVSILSVGADGTLSSNGAITDDALLELLGPVSLTTGQVGAATYLFAAGADDDGVSVFEVLANGALDNRYNVTDEDNPAYALDGVTLWPRR